MRSLISLTTPYARELDKAYWQLTQHLRKVDGELTESLGEVTRCLAEVLNVSRASIWQLNEDQKTLRCKSIYSLTTKTYQSSSQVTLSRESFPNLFESIEHSRIIDAADTSDNSRFKEFNEKFLKPFDIRSMLMATLRPLGLTAGVIALTVVGKNREWTEEEKVFIASVADMISQTLLLNKLRSSELRYEALYVDSKDCIMIFDGPVVIDCNPAAPATFRTTREQLLGKTIMDFSPEFQSDGQRSEDLVKAVNESSGKLPETQRFTWLHRRADHTEFYGEVNMSVIKWDGSVYFISRTQDITERVEAEKRIREYQKQIEYKASHDALTGLPNRDSLHSLVEQLIKNIQQNNRSSGLVLALFDLNGFKEVNDTLGHSVGDGLLQNLSVGLQQELKNIGARLFRLGGDEFVVVNTLENSNSTSKSVDAINQFLQTPLSVGNISLEMRASIGLAYYPEHGDDSHELLRCADVAMYAAKNAGENVEIYTPAKDTHSTRRLTMMSELGVALRENQLQLYFQPRIDLNTGQLTGCEALIRWHHPEYGMVPPGEFIPLAEMSDIIHPLTYWVVEHAIKQTQCWQNQGLIIPIAVNISARNLSDIRMPETLGRMIAEYKINTDLLELEVTESALMNHPQRAIDNLKKLDQMGLTLAIDDFGTGYSSLSYLKKLPIDVLKIDQSFVRDMLTDDSDHVIVSSTIDLAHNFSLKVVAEGVEDEATLASLTALGCDQAQGYFVAKPMPTEEFESWLGHFIAKPPRSAKSIKPFIFPK